MVRIWQLEFGNDILELKSKAEKMEVVNYLLSTLRRDQRHLITYILGNSNNSD